MNNTHLEQIIDNYLTRFDELNRTHEEYYKWLIACRFKDAMDEALDASDKDFPGKLLTVKKLTENLIDSYTRQRAGCSCR